MMRTPSDRLLSLPPYVFSEINKIKAEAQKKGISLLSVGIGDPDLPTPAGIVEKMKEAISRPENHLYSPYEGTLSFRESVANWFSGRFGVELNPQTEVMALIGSKEGVAHFPQAFCNPGDFAIYPSPGYPIFQTSILMTGATPVALPLRAENGFVPDPQEFEKLILEKKVKFAWLNFPSNPTSAVCSKEILQALVTIAKRHQVVIGYDNAYSEIYYSDSEKPISILQIPGGKEVAIEFHSLSKSYNMTGWRIGFAVGNAELIASLLKVKTNIDSGPLLAVQEVASYALAHSDKFCPEIRKVYEGRRAIFLAGLKKLGVEYLIPKATFFVWAQVPKRMLSMDFTKHLIEKAGLVVTPGAGFGEEGEYFFRVSLTVPELQLKEALIRLEKGLASLDA